MANAAGTEFTELPYAVEEKTKEFGVGTFLRRKKIGPDLRDHIIMDVTGSKGFTMQHYYAVRRIEFQMKRLALNIKKRRGTIMLVLFVPYNSCSGKGAIACRTEGEGS